MRSETVALVFAVSLSMFGCNKGSDGEGTAAESEGAIGVAECDAYVKKMEAFLDGLPEEARAAREPGFKAMRQAWRDAAQAPGGKEGLAATCKENLANVPSK
ncbi:hypothetical protein [Polyangium sp. 15x6]|uniref:hypothetical protein n=1 Tax=Polyangium sp. 15x6 TaxID=3042687 RepID=UPI00249C0979|nr:hypothetical protein [Polyangium sp. 15x6]MDI3286975.1 hypothetical protein [Polyangium sp. 15x6]